MALSSRGWRSWPAGAALMLPPIKYLICMTLLPSYIWYFDSVLALNHPVWRTLLGSRLRVATKIEARHCLLCIGPNAL